MSSGAPAPSAPTAKVPNQEFHLYSAFFTIALYLSLNLACGDFLHAHTTVNTTSVKQRGMAVPRVVGRGEGGRGGFLPSGDHSREVFGGKKIGWSVRGWSVVDVRARNTCTEGGLSPHEHVPTVQIRGSGEDGTYLTGDRHTWVRPTLHNCVSLQYSRSVLVGFSTQSYYHSISTTTDGPYANA